MVAHVLRRGVQSRGAEVPSGQDFRVQEGVTTAAAATPALIEQGRAALEASGLEALYARVDGIERDGVFLLMELELIEPSLFLEYGAGLVGTDGRVARTLVLGV